MTEQEINRDSKTRIVGANRSSGDLRPARLSCGQNATCNMTASHSRPCSRSSSDSRLPLLPPNTMLSRAKPPPSSACCAELVNGKVASQLKDMGFSVSSIGAAAQRLGASHSFDDLLHELLSASPDVQSPSLPLLRPSSQSSEFSRELTVSDELEQMGFPLRVIAATLARLGPRADLKGALEAVLHEPDSPLEQKDAWICAVCLDRQQQHGWQCPDEHRFCAACMRQHIKAVAFPRCPQCTYELTVPDLRLLKVSHGRVEVFELSKLQHAVATLGADKSNDALGEKLIRCKQEGCQNAVLVQQKCRECFACPCGAPSFCTQCGEIPYHYHADCASVKALRERWLDWVREAQKARKREQAALRALLERCRQDRDLREDENWKATHCRLCPHCGRIVEKIDGCDSMRCGSNYHGGGLQQGCGKEFDWNMALPYQPQRVKRPSITKITFEKDNWVKGLFHPGTKCDGCDRDIYGPRLRCIHCESFNVCSECQTCLDNHDFSHVFEIMCQVDFDWSGVFLPPGLFARISRSGNARPPKWFGKQHEGTVCKIGDVVKGESPCTGFEPGARKSRSTHYKVKIKGHHGSDPEMPVEHLVPLFTSRLEATRLLEGRWNEPEPDPEENVPWIRF